MELMGRPPRGVRGLMVRLDFTPGGAQNTLPWIRTTPKLAAIPRMFRLPISKIPRGGSARTLGLGQARSQWRIMRRIAAASSALVAGRWEYAGWGKPLLGLMAPLLPEAGVWKTISFRLRSIRRPWGSILAVDVKLKR